MTFYGFIGTNGAGKSSACDYLKTLGYSVFSLSDIVRAEVASRGLPSDRDTLTETANEMKRKDGEAVFAQKVFELSQAQGLEKVVFDSIRHEKEVAYLQNQGVVLIGVDAPVSVRFSRVQDRKRATDSVDFVTFQRQDEYENSGQSFGQNIHACLEKCDYKITNDQGLDGLHSELDAILERRPV